MWIKFLAVILLFYIFALLQNSFFIYFDILGAVPNFIFIFFFLLVFFSKKENYYEIFFYALLAGVFLDIFSIFGLGISTVLLLIIGLLVKKVLLMLKEKEEKYPFIYFTGLFIASFLAYYLFLEAYLYIFNQQYISLNLNQKFLVKMLYSLFFAEIEFLIYKKFAKDKINNQQVRFFRNVLQ